jgi:hypothetical protein
MSAPRKPLTPIAHHGAECLFFSKYGGAGEGFFLAQL